MKSKGTRRYGWSILSGAAIFLAVSLRTVGVALLPTLLLPDLLGHRRLNRISLTIAMITLDCVIDRAAGCRSIGRKLRIYYKLFVFTPADNIEQFYWAFAQPSTNSAFSRVVIGIFSSWLRRQRSACCMRRQGAWSSRSSSSPTLSCCWCFQFRRRGALSGAEPLVLGAVAARGETLIHTPLLKNCLVILTLFLFRLPSNNA